MELLELIGTLQAKAKKDVFEERERKAALDALEAAAKTWREGGEVNLSHPAAISTLEKAKVLGAKKPVGAGELVSFGRFARAAWFDAAGRLGPYKWFVRCFFAGAIAFLALAPQYLPSILSLVFVIPIYLALKGLKKRTKDGLNLGMSIFPMTLLAAVMAIRSYVAAFGDWGAYIERQVASYGVSAALTTVMSIAFFAIAVLGAVAALFGTYLGFKHRKMYA